MGRHWFNQNMTSFQELVFPCFLLASLMHAMVLGLEAIKFQGSMVKGDTDVQPLGCAWSKSKLKPLAIQSAMHVSHVLCASPCVAYRQRSCMCSCVECHEDDLP